MKENYELIDNEERHPYFLYTLFWERIALYEIHIGGVLHYQLVHGVLHQL